MKKLVFTLAFGLFFVAFTNAQNAQSEKNVEAEQIVEVTSTSNEKAACEPDCTKPCCADKKEVKAASNSKKETSCDSKSKKAADCKTTSTKAAKASCADKKASCSSKRPSCGSKKS